MESSVAAARAEDSEGTCTVSAAARVFGIAELLEMILVRITPPPCDDFYRSWIYDRGTSNSLFILQRVNKDFQATIASSKVLQQRMYLALYPSETSEPGVSSADPLEWFSHRQLGSNGVRSVTCQYGPADWMVLWISPMNSPAHKLHASELRPEASWRKMKIYCIEDAAPETITIEFTLHGTRECRDIHWLLTPADTITLGQLRDALQRLMQSLDVKNKRLKSIKRPASYKEALRVIEEKLTREASQIKF